MEEQQVRTAGALDQELYPMKLWKLSKREGVWNPDNIDLTEDARQWNQLDDRERDLLLRITAQFYAGEDSVASQLLPLLRVVAAEKRMEEELFLTAYLWEEAKHVDAFGRFLSEVAGVTNGWDRYFTPAYRQLFFRELPRTMHRLENNHSPVVQAKAATTYQLIIEGTLAEAGYEAYHTILKKHRLLPGMLQIVEAIRRDEARHIDYGTYLLARLVAQHKTAVWDAIETRVERLLPLVKDHIDESLAPYGDQVPFALKAEELLEPGLARLRKRMRRIGKARSTSLEEAIYEQPVVSGAHGTVPA